MAVVGVSSRCRSACLVALGLLLAACDSGTPDATVVDRTSSTPTTATRAQGFDSGPVKTAAEFLAEPEFAAADAARGELLGLACAAPYSFWCLRQRASGHHTLL